MRISIFNLNRFALSCKRVMGIPTYKMFYCRLINFENIAIVSLPAICILHSAARLYLRNLTFLDQ